MQIKNKAYLNTITNVLVEGQSKNNKNFYTGRTESFKPVNFSANETDIGQIIPVLITGAKTFSLFGESVR